MNNQLAPPPRRVPLSLRIANMFNGASQIGWVLFGFGGIFFWVFAMSADFSFVTFRGEVNRAIGEVLRVERTGASEGGGKNSSGTPIYAAHYAYSVAGQQLTGTSYSLGERVAPGERVDVEFLASNPLRSRIRDMRRNIFGPWASLVSLFPLIGVAIAYWGFKVGRHRNHLLRNGLISMGTLVDKQPTNMLVNKQRVYELTFEFTARDGQRHRAKARTHVTSKLQDEAQEPLLYDPDNPQKAYLLDEAPARPTVDGVGELQGRPSLALGLLIIPVIVIIGHGIAAVWKLGLM